MLSSARVFAQTDCTDLTRICSDLAPPVSATEADLLSRTAASALNTTTMTVAVVDRAGRAVAVFRQPNADPRDTDIAVGLARTAAFFSHDQAPLSSRTVRFISGVHFPPGVKRTPNAALYGIEATNHGCDFNVTFNRNRCIPRARSVLREGPCNNFDNSGCGPGIVTGKFANPYGPTDQEFEDEPPGHNPFAVKVNPGGLPLYRPGLAPLGIAVVGGIGVAGVAPGEAEYAAFTAARENGFFIEFRADRGQVVLIDGIRLPFVDPREWPRNPARGSGAGGFFLAPRDGACAPERYLVGPRDGRMLSRAEVDRIVRQSVEGANNTKAAIRLPFGSPARMVIAVADIDGTILGLYRMRDSTIFSIDVAVAKSRNVIWFSTDGVHDLPGVEPGTAVSNRTISFGAQALYPPGIDASRGDGGGPWFDLFKRTSISFCSQGSQLQSRNQNGIVFFPGSTPLYRDGVLVGGLGISGDGVEQDDHVSFLGAQGFLPDEEIRADRLFVRGVRLPFFKFPRQPEDVTRDELKIGPEEIE